MGEARPRVVPAEPPGMRPLRNMGFLLCACLSGAAPGAENYPVKPIRIVVGFVAGGAVDFNARLLAARFGEYFGQPVIVENRPGAGSSMATERVAASPADGYTLLLMATSGVVQAVLRTNLPYLIERDLTPVSLVSSGAFLLATHPSLPVRNVRELIALARVRPGVLNTASPGIGTANHLAGELFNQMAGVDIVHVPYKGGAESTVAAASGETAMTFAAVAVALPLVTSGKLRPLAISSAKRASLLPAIPTIAEQAVPGYDYAAWYGMLAPSGVPREIVLRLNAALNRALQSQEVSAALLKQGLEPASSSPEQFAELIRIETARSGELIRRTGLKAD